jgi:hypothetical protein
MKSISENRTITLARIEFDTLSRALQFEADARAAESRGFEVSDGHHRWPSLKQIEC